MAPRLLIGVLVALAALAGGGALHFQRLSDRQTARAEQLAADLARARVEATRERERADRLVATATQLDTQLGHAKTRSTATESKNSQLSRELQAAHSSLTERQQREIALLTEIEALRQQIRAATEPATDVALPSSSAVLETPAQGPVVTTTAASAPPAVAAPPPSAATLVHEQVTAAGPTAVEDYRRRITILETQLAELLARALAEPPAPPPSAPAAPSPYQVVRIGPGAAFVIVDYGTLHGAAPGEELVLGRGTSVVARVQISDARARFSIAQVLPAALKGQLQPGDFVLIAK